MVAAIGRMAWVLGLPGCRPWPVRCQCFLYWLVCSRRNDGALYTMMKPTPNLRFINRGSTRILYRILQQQWVDDASQESEWRDVPTGEEDSG